MIIYPALIGRFGNKLFQYAYARAFAERYGHEVRTGNWEGCDLFGLPMHEVPPGLPTEDESTIARTNRDCMLHSYCQSQYCVSLYSRTQAREWFTFLPEVLDLYPVEPYEIVAHRRVGDYVGSGYPVISYRAVHAAVEMYYPDRGDEVHVVSDDFEHAWMPDFLTMMRAPILFRGNSSFSWWAAVLGHGIVYSPVIDGLVGGQEHDKVPYVRGNHPRLAELPGVEELRLRE